MIFRGVIVKSLQDNRNECRGALGMDGEGLMVKKTTHEGSQVLNRSWGRMVMLCISHGGEKHGVVHISWGRKAQLVWKFPGEERGCNVVAKPEGCCA
ncbi:hypothetical protein F2Q69_00039893 [Brassica cretica]|uniref:Uncharacterized protein n=1 Tax=Brassica cretica TaxID=69181 RepID=A0A8S9NF76_BRACR|nr:hypothetical protein F2Q69_00039893 [Brassica cretica]